MNANKAQRNAIMTDALNYIDEDIIADVVGTLKTPFTFYTETAPAKKSVFKSIKYAAAVAACGLLLSTLIPVVDYVTKNLHMIIPGLLETTAETSDFLTEETEDTYLIPDEHIENAPYFIFSPDLEPISTEKMEEIRGAFYQLVYDFEYPVAYSLSKMSPYYANDDEKAVQVASNNADYNAKKYKELVFSDNAENHNTVRYYGTVEGYVILMMNTALPDEYNVMHLGDVTISNPTSFYIYAYKCQTFTPLEELYADSEISASSIVLIAKRHSEFNSVWEDQEVEYYYPEFTADLEELSEEKINEIGDYFYNQAFNDMPSYQKDYEDMKKYHGGYGERRIREMVFGGLYKKAESARNTYFDKDDERCCRYYGTFGESVVLVNVSMMDAITQFELAGYKFFFPTMTDIKVYNNGRVISLTEAYNEGLLTNEDIGVIHKRHDLYEEYLKK